MYNFIFCGWIINAIQKSLPTDKLAIYGKTRNGFLIIVEINGFNKKPNPPPSLRRRWVWLS